MYRRPGLFQCIHKSCASVLVSWYSRDEVVNCEGPAPGHRISARWRSVSEPREEPHNRTQTSILHSSLLLFFTSTCPWHQTLNKAQQSAPAPRPSRAAAPSPAQSASGARQSAPRSARHHATRASSAAAPPTATGKTRLSSECTRGSADIDPPTPSPRTWRPCAPSCATYAPSSTRLTLAPTSRATRRAMAGPQATRRTRQSPSRLPGARTGSR
jgi:hypothetical protein